MASNRRFWPVEVRVPQIKIKRLKKQLPQIWAETVELYRAMRKEQPYGTLPLYLAKDAARVEAELLQEDRRVEGLEDTFAKTVLDWFQTPITRRGVEEDMNGGFSDLDKGDKDADVLGLRTTFTSKEAWTDAVGRPETQYDARMQSLMGLALAQIDIISKPKLRMMNGTRTRYYHRVGSNAADLWVPLPEGHETPK